MENVDRSVTNGQASQSLREAQERGLLLCNSIAIENYRDRGEKQGVRGFLNRLQLLMQEPMVVAVLSEVTISPDESEKFAGKHFRVLFHTMLDPLWKEQFEIRLRDEEFQGFTLNDYFYLPFAKAKGKVIKIHNDHHALFFRMDLKNIDTNTRLPFILYNEHDNVSLREFLKHFREDSILHNALVSDGLSLEFDKRASDKHWQNGRIILREPDTDLSYDFGLSGLDPQAASCFYSDCHNKISEIFNVCYQKVYKSSLIKLNDLQPPNLMFAVRFFDSTEKRFSGSGARDPLYPYGVRAVIPELQRQDFLHSLNLLGDLQKDHRFRDFWRNKESGVFHFPKPLSRSRKYCDLTSKDFPQGGNHRFMGSDEFFWEMLNSSGGVESIVEEMKLPYSLEARPLSDIVFSGGFVRIAPEPYAASRGVRLNYSACIRGPQSADYRRTVYYHYLMSMAARGGGSVSSLLVPGIVNGTPWFSMGYYFSSGEREHQRWLNCYHFYHSVARSFIRGIRIRLRKLYLDELTRIYASAVRVSLPRDHPHLMLEKYPGMVNPYFRLLCRVYPYDLVQLEFLAKERYPDLLELKEDEREQGVHELVLSGQRFYFRVYTQANPYFESFTEAKYHSLSLLIEKLDEVGRQNYH